MLIISLFLCLNIKSDAQIGRLSLSPKQTIKQTIGLTDIVIDYSRPSMRGRQVFGDLVPYGKYWRTGANRSTTIEISHDFFIDDQKVAKGKYAIFSIPNLKEWVVVLYNDTDNWDVPTIVDTAKIVARTAVSSVQIESTREVLSIQVGDFTNYEFDLIIGWENTQVSIPIHLDTRNLMEEKINKRLGGPTYSDYYLAATYEMESGHDYERGLDWINKAIDIAEEVGWWDLRIKTILLMNLGKSSQARELAKQGLVLGQKEKREYAITEFQRMLRELGQ